MTALYAAFALVTLWLVGEVLMQRRAPVHWRVLALLGFLAVELGVYERTVVIIGAGVLLFGVGQIFVTQAVRRGTTNAWGVTPPWSRGAAPAAPPAPARPALHVEPIEEADGSAPEAPADVLSTEPGGAAEEPGGTAAIPVYAGEPGAGGYGPDGYPAPDGGYGYPQQTYAEPAPYGAEQPQTYGGEAAQPAYADAYGAGDGGYPAPQQPYGGDAYGDSYGGDALAGQAPYQATAYDQAAYGYDQPQPGGYGQDGGAYGYPQPAYIEPLQQPGGPGAQPAVPEQGGYPYDPAQQTYGGAPQPGADPSQGGGATYTPTPYDPFESGAHVRPAIPGQPHPDPYDSGAPRY